MRRAWPLLLVWLGAATLGHDAAHADIELKVQRFFDPCIEDSANIEQASGEACIIQAIFNAFSAEDNGTTVDLLPPHRDNYYPQLIAAYAAGAPPDVHLLHRHRLPDFASAGLLAPLNDDLPSVGLDMADWEEAARAAVTIDDKIVAVPFDLHANLWHINLSLLGEAGLIASDGRPILPASPGELMDHAQQVKAATGKAYLAADFVQYPIGVRAVLSLLWQQGENVFDGGEAQVDTAEMRAAITTFTDLFDAGLANPAHDYESAQQAFLDGEVAILINGTWAVDLYDREVSRGEIALTDYDVADFPTLFASPATWTDSHLWAVPASLKAERPEAYEAAMQLLSWINEHNLDWARTGHLAVRSSVLESDAYATLAHRVDYRQSAKLGRDLPVTSGYDEIHDVMIRCLEAIWLDGSPLDDALAGAEADIQSLLQ
ncbi:MAG: extracellular solute-binding protein [Alphaproteobacteria bacterium]|nr:extracellular solute-binding protein [Alphaproteobacteria bacterium]